MAIKFPQVHIAESVANRILNVYDDLRASGKIQPAPPSEPNVPDIVPPDTMLQGATIEAATTPTAQPGPLQDPTGMVGAGAVARGDNLLDVL
jgi:hypothetical protein